MRNGSDRVTRLARDDRQIIGWYHSDSSRRGRYLVLLPVLVILVPVFSSHWMP